MKNLDLVDHWPQNSTTQVTLMQSANVTHVLQLGMNPNHIHIQIDTVCLVDNQQNRAFHLMAISKIHRHRYITDTVQHFMFF